jgi:4-amino-4-deoxy-L-arabinose transferase-like glycosyltransferase
MPHVSVVTRPSPGRTLTALFDWVARHQYLALGGVLLVMLLIRVVGLGTFPDTLNPDEADNIEGAVRILHGAPPDNGFFGLDWYGEPAMTAYLFAAAIKVFGFSQFGARVLTALISVLSLGVFYVLVRRQVAVVPALLATLLFGSQLWYLQMSRMAWNNEHLTLFTLCAVYALLSALRAPATRRGRLWFLACGVCCTLTLYGYPAGRMLLPSLYLLLPLAILRNRRRWMDILAGYVAMGLITIVLCLPEAVYIAAHWPGFMKRFSDVVIFNKPEFQATPLHVLMQQLVANFLGFWAGSFNNMPSHFPVGEPLLDPLTGVLVAAGAAASVLVRRFRVQFETWLWWSIFVLGWFVSEVLTDRTPDGSRATSWMPALFIFAGFALDVGWAWASKLGGAARGLAFAAASLAVVLAASSDVVHYVNWMSQPSTREMRQPYITVAEFGDWSTAILQRADSGGPSFSVGEWQSGAVTGVPAAPPAGLAGAPSIQLPATPREQWLDIVSTFGSDGPGRLSDPRAIALDHDGNVYVVDADPAVQAIKKFDRDGRFLTTWGSPGPENGQFRSAWAIAVDSQNHVLVLDAETAWVQVFDSVGNYLARWGGPDSTMYHPRAMAIAADDTVFIADTGRGRIVQSSANGGPESEFTTTGGDLATEPAGLAALSNGELLVADAKQGALRTFSTAGGELARSDLMPAIALDGPRPAQLPDGSLYVTLPQICAIEHLSAAGEPLSTYGNCPTTDYLKFPSAIALDSDGRLYVADRDEHAIKVLQMAPQSP